MQINPADINPNVDDMLIENMTGKKLDPLPTKPVEVPRETAQAQEPSILEAKSAPEPQKVEPKSETNEYGDTTEAKAEEPKETNEYGLETEPEKLYTRAELDEHTNRVMRERVARFERNQQQQQPTQQQQQQAQQQGFEYNENSNLDWQQQLEQFVHQVADKRDHNRAAQLQRAQEEARVEQFGMKFKQGMSAFKDYHDVVGKFDIKDDMLFATEGVKNPAALFYAAALRAPKELEAISNMATKEQRAFAIGQLDAKLRKQPVKVSSAPKPVTQTKADTVATGYQPKQIVNNPLDDMIAADSAKRLAQQNARRR